MDYPILKCKTDWTNKRKIILNPTIDTLIAFTAKIFMKQNVCNATSLMKIHRSSSKKCFKKKITGICYEHDFKSGRNVTKTSGSTKMLAEYPTKMTFQNITVEEAKKIVEFFRKVGNETPPIKK